MEVQVTGLGPGNGYLAPTVCQLWVLFGKETHFGTFNRAHSSSFKTLTINLTNQDRMFHVHSD